MEQQQIFEYLNRLQYLGVRSMWKVDIYLQQEFGLTEKEAKEWLIKWMNQFEQDLVKEEG